MYFKNFIMLLKRYTTSSLLNILGMAVAFAAVYIIMVQVNFDLSYNKGIPNAKNIYRLEYPNWSEEGRVAKHDVVYANLNEPFEQYKGIHYCVNE